MDNFICPICTCLAENAVETSCCGNLFCEKCLQAVIAKNDTCPICRQQNIRYNASIMIRRMINELEINCAHCNSKIKRTQQVEHEKQCDQRVIQCCFMGCNDVSGNKNYILQHMVKRHPEKVIEICEFPQNNVQQCLVTQMNPLGAQITQNGRQARLGISGKYYCGGQYEGRCTCDGNCGPSNGCNCLGCMKLDLKLRNITSKGYLVNNDGFQFNKNSGRIARQLADKSFGCGVLLNNQQSCGVQGNRCKACQHLQMNNRYQSMLE